MSAYPCSCGQARSGGVITASVILGIIATFLRFTATITVGTTFLWAVFTAAVAYLGVALAVTALSGCCGALSRCACPLLTALLVGALGSTLLSVALLVFTFAAASLVGAVLFGVLIFFFTLLLLSTAALARRLSSCEE